jgi:hypothetical protein
VAAAAHLQPLDHVPRPGVEGARRVGRASTEREVSVRQPNRGGRPR